MESAKPASSLAKAAADAAGPANRDVFLNSCTPLDSPVGRHRLGRINAESARALFSQPGKLRAVFETVSITAPRLTELPGQGEKPKTQNGFRRGFAPLPHLGEYSLQADFPAKNLMITEHTPVRSFHWPPLNAQGLRRPVFRFPGLIAWVPEGKFAMPLPPVDGRYPGTTAGEPTSYWMASSGIIQATVRAADENHPLTKLSPRDPAFWKCVRFMALEWELVSLGTREITVPLFTPSENPLSPTIRRKRQP